MEAATTLATAGAGVMKRERNIDFPQILAQTSSPICGRQMHISHLVAARKHNSKNLTVHVKEHGRNKLEQSIPTASSVASASAIRPVTPAAPAGAPPHSPRRATSGCAPRLPARAHATLLSGRNSDPRRPYPPASVLPLPMV